jgi:uncharacterized damage-inducible protein DinB
MNAKDVLKQTLTATQDMVAWFLADLSDQDLLVRPVPAANHIAAQLGHLISSETMLGAVLPGATYPALPAALKAAGGGMPKEDPQGGYLKKAEYLEWLGKVRAATIANLEADLDKPTSGDMAKYAGTLGAVLLLVSHHTLMHAGQFSVVRRALGKPVLF